MKRLSALLCLVVAALAAPALASASVVTDWNRTMIDVLEATHAPPPAAARASAIVTGSVFDAVNGIARQYTPLHVDAQAPRAASKPAAVVAAAHEALLRLFPAQQPLLDQRYAEFLAALGSSPPVERGLAWGNDVADAIVTWRAPDGTTSVPPPYVGAVGVAGRWQPTPPLFGPPLFRQYATATPFALASPGQFALPGPPPLASAHYARDYQEVLELGSVNSVFRLPEQTQTARFWQLDTPAAMWDRAADTLLDADPVSLVRDARVLALTDVALADTTIAVWNAKNAFDTWRPVTAIAGGIDDGNAATAPDVSWAPLLATPQFQEYPSAHSAVSAAAASVLASFFGDSTSFTVESAGLPGVQRSFTSFSDAVAQIADARIYAGFHFRFSCDDGITLGREIADYVETTHLLRAHGEGDA